jgi:hypothetical protein
MNGNSLNNGKYALSNHTPSTAKNLSNPVTQQKREVNIMFGLILLSLSFGYAFLVIATHFGMSFKKAAILSGIISAAVLVAVLIISGNT